jgi:hypothetical protein
MSHATEQPVRLAGSQDGILAYNGSTWTAVPSWVISGVNNGPADTAMISHYHTGVSYSGGGVASPYTSTYWAAVIAFLGFGRLYSNNSATTVAGTKPPSYATGSANFPMAVSLPAGTYLSIFTLNDGNIGAGTFAEVRQYSERPNGTDGQYHSHRTRVASNAQYGSMSIARLVFTETRYLYIRAVTFGNASAVPVYLANQSFGFQIVRLNTVT